MSEGGYTRPIGPGVAVIAQPNFLVDQEIYGMYRIENLGGMDKMRSFWVRWIDSSEG